MSPSSMVPAEELPSDLLPNSLTSPPPPPPLPGHGPGGRTTSASALSRLSRPRFLPGGTPPTCALASLSLLNLSALFLHIHPSAPALFPDDDGPAPHNSDRWSSPSLASPRARFVDRALLRVPAAAIARFTPTRERSLSSVGGATTSSSVER